MVKGRYAQVHRPYKQIAIRTVLGVIFAYALFFYTHLGTKARIPVAVGDIGLVGALLAWLLGRPVRWLERGGAWTPGGIAFATFNALMGICLTFAIGLRAAPHVRDGGPPPTSFLAFPAHTVLQYTVQAATGLTLGFILWLAGEWISRRPNGAGRTGLAPSPFWYALPALVGWTLLLATYWPGIMSSDSMDQWRQATANRYIDWHPFYHTWLVHGVRQLWDCPALVAGLQSWALALSSGWLIHAAQRATGTSTRVAWIGALLCAACPPLAFTSITLWKDVPYAAALTALAAFSLSLVHTGRPDPARPIVFTGMLFVTVTAMLFRHNGPPAAIATLFALGVLVPARRRAIAVLGITAVVCFVVMGGPLQRALGVTHVDTRFTLAAHHIAAHRAAGEAPADQQNAALLDRIDPTPDWRYTCGVVDPTIFDRTFDAPLAAQEGARLVRIAADLALAHPLTEAKHIACVGSLVWSINGAPTSHGRMYATTTGLSLKADKIGWIMVNNEDLREDSAFPDAAQWLGHAYLDLDILTRPGLYALALAFACAIAIRRSGSWRLVVAGVTPIFMHTAVLGVVNVAQDARYQLPMFVACLALAPALTRVRSIQLSLTGTGTGTER